MRRAHSTAVDISPSSNTDTSEIKTMDEVVLVPGLGRPLQLGMVYDCRQDKLIAGISLWNAETLKEKRNIIKMENSESQIITEDTLHEKCRAFHIDGEMKLSIIGGLVPLEGSAKYLQHKKTSSKTCRITLRYTCSSCFVTLTMDQMNKSGIEHHDAFINDTATHVVTAVEYGVDAMFVFDYQLSGAEDEAQVKGLLKGIFDKIPQASKASGQGNVEYKEEEKQKTQQLKCMFHGDVILENLPTTFEEALVVLKDLPSTIKKTAGPDGIYGVPKKVHLYPLSKLDWNAARLTHSISSHIISDACDLVEDLNTKTMQIVDFMSDDLFKIFTGVRNQLTRFMNSMNKFSIAYQRQLALIVPKIRGGMVGEGELEQLLCLIKNSPFEAGSLKKWMDIKKRELGWLKGFYCQLQNYTFAIHSGDLETLTLNGSKKYVVAISLAEMDTEKNAFLDAMEGFHLTGETSNNVLDCDSLLKDQWFNDQQKIEHLKSRITYFREFTGANLDQGDIEFVVVLNESKEKSLGDITLYWDMKESAFEPPSAPRTAPKMISSTNDSITISWTAPAMGYESVVHYIVLYQSLNETEKHKWTSITTSNNKTECTIDELDPGTRYLFKVTAVCNVGQSQPSKVSLPYETKKLSSFFWWWRIYFLGLLLICGSYDGRDISVLDLLIV